MIAYYPKRIALIIFGRLLQLGPLCCQEFVEDLDLLMIIMCRGGSMEVRVYGLPGLPFQTAKKKKKKKKKRYFATVLDALPPLRKSGFSSSFVAGEIQNMHITCFYIFSVKIWFMFQKFERILQQIITWKLLEGLKVTVLIIPQISEVKNLLIVQLCVWRILQWWMKLKPSAMVHWLIR